MTPSQAPGALTPVSLSNAHFVSLTTFRRSGVGVSTPVWIARFGTFVVITTPAESGKVKRLRNDARVELRPCDRRGAVKPGAPTVQGVAEILSEPEAVTRHEAVFARKYGFEYRVFMLIERIALRGKPARRVILRIAAPH
ncbi:PPOX class F420-dependent oxidoreductase [Subtercola lobariae]|nr:PPOX class F420-dependent oxidoreductase [Subtercola lobariae]